jgi:two-component system NtrC family sensor kinase
MSFSHDTFEQFRLLSQQIMQYAMRGLLRIDFLNEVSKSLMEFSGCDAVEMWLKERGRYYRGEVKRSAEPQFRFEIMQTEEVRGRIIPLVAENDLLRRLGRDIILRQTAPFRKCITPDESFWTDDVESVYKQVMDIYGFDNSVLLGRSHDIKSLVIIPISVEDEDIGLLLMKGKSRGFFSNDDVEFYERVVNTLGMAMIHRRTQVELRERIKELSCLYSIAKMAEDKGLSLNQILQGIVDLMPPGWLFPEITSARITLDGISYSTPGYQASVYRQAAEIIIEDEKRGTVEVNYSQEKPELDEGPFLREERDLIDTIAQETALIIERKQNDEDKARLQDQLRHADRLATIGQLSAGIAHELNEPIGSILGFAQLIQKSSDLPQQVGQDAEKIKKASLHAREVIKKLMLFARQMPPIKTGVNLNQIVVEGLYFLESRCAKEGIAVERILSEDLPEILADPAQMTQVLVNIVVNAVHAMPGGGKLTIQTKSDKKYVSLSITDTGTGMPEKIKKQVFLPFFTTKDIGEGTGLGLAVVYGIVSSHAGSIDFESESGKGTKFEVKLPVSPSQSGQE